MRIIFYQFKILIFEVEYTLDFRIYLHLRKRTRLAGKLKSNLLKVICIDVCIAGSMDKLSRLKTAHLGNHHGQ